MLSLDLKVTKHREYSGESMDNLLKQVYSHLEPPDLHVSKQRD